MMRLRSRGGGRSSAFRTGLLLSLVPGFLGIALLHWPPTESLENTGFDLLFLLRGARPGPANVRVVAIDEDSYQVLGIDPAAPWPRRLHAQLIRTLAKEGAKAIAFDVLFEEARDPSEDHDLEQALADTGIVVLGSTVDQVQDPRFRQARLIEPYGPFAAKAAAVADVNLPTDRDGVIRRGWLSHEGRPGLALAAYEVATRDRTRGQATERLIDYYGPARQVRTISIYQALDPGTHLPPGTFRDSIVFVGLSQPAASGPAAKDAFPTPFRGAGGELTYGVEIHATLAANLLENRRISLAPAWAEGAWLLALPFAGALLFVALRPALGIVALAGLELLPWTAGYAAFTRGHLWIPVMIPAVIQLPLTYVATLVWYYLTTVRERERIRRAFSFYLSPQMIGKIAAHPESLNLGGEEIVATALFTDIKGFTSLAERLTAPQTAALLNRYFSETTRHVFEAGGTLIKYIGDAVFAIWGAPLHVEDHAFLACRAALSMSRRREVLSDAGATLQLITRVGVHTGPMLVGNLGSEQRFDYTAIGDAVNLASRLEGLNKPFGTRALASGETVSGTAGRLVVRGLGRARVVGRAEPVEIFELLALSGDPTLPDAATLKRFASAHADFSGGMFKEAADGFRAVLESTGGTDGPAKFFLELAKRFEAEPPDDWDGVVTFESK